MKLCQIAALVLIYSQTVQAQASSEMSEAEHTAFEFMAVYASLDDCFRPGVDYFLDREKDGFAFSDIETEVLYFSKYVCSYLSEDSLDTYKYGTALAFKLKAWPDGYDCRPIKAAAKNLGKYEEFITMKNENDFICYDDYIIE